MAKLTKRLEEIRDRHIIQMYNEQVSAEDIGILFNLSTSAIYLIVKDGKNG